MKNTFLIFIATLIYLNSYGQFRKLEKRNHNVNKLVKEIISNDDFKNANFSFLAIDLNTHEIISQHNPDKALKPASTQKLFSTATMLELYGPDFQFETKLAYTGVIDTINRVLNGDIIIKGGGDPALGSKHFETTENKLFLAEWLNAIKSLGIDSVSGRIIADASIYSYDMVPATWSWQYLGNYYGAGACGISIYDNSYSLYLNSSEITGDTTIISSISPKISNLIFENAVIADSINHDNAYIFGTPYTYYRYLRGEIPLGKTDFRIKGSIPDPAYFAALELEKTLKNNGIKLKENATTVRILNKSYTQHHEREFLTTTSPELSKIIKETNVHSINLFAEHCLNHAGIKLGANLGTSNATESVKDYWKEKGMDIQGLSLHDGSGLSHYNVITPRQMVFLLDYLKNKSPYYDIFYNSLPIAGVSGTIEYMFKNSLAEGQLHAKSGTLSKVKAYAGYVKSQSGREIAFSMVFNNFSCSSNAARADLEKLMIALAEFNK